MSGDVSSDDTDQLRACREAARRRLLREHVGTIVRAIRAPLADVLREHALVHLPPAAAARLRLVHPSWAHSLASPLFAVAHAAATRRISGLFAPSTGLLPFDGADTVPSPSLAFLPTSSGLTVLSSSHGLACCFSLADDAYFVCNPATASWAGVPSPPHRTLPRPAIVVVFDASVCNFRGDYTLVCAFESAPGSGTYCFAVFTSGTGAWWVADAVAPAEGLVPASGVAAGGTAWWRTSIGTAVGYNPVTGRVELVMCPSDSGQWEIGSAAGRLHCAVRDDGDVVVFRLDGHGGWEEAARVAVADILEYRQPEPAHEQTEAEAGDEAEETEEEHARAIVAVANRVHVPDDDVQMLPFQGAQVEVVVLAGRRVVAFDTVTRRRREAALPDQPGMERSDAVYAAHTNTLALVAPLVLTGEPAPVTDPLDDRDKAPFS
ncbi:uncharacterized protein LOC133914110 [Phragmites australis]|uniref:uncharacterized protein LOC133914110 n=1 Tax=Phragmites australis TaxID=29695 RepID=UPI002D7948F1|nr:uncharacterized protein LOC133914110 [Phragmites australis]